MVKVICYNQETVYENRQDAINEFKLAVASCEGSERERYQAILFDLLYTDKETISDETS